MLLIAELRVVRRACGDAGAAGRVQIQTVFKLLIGDVGVHLALLGKAHQLIGVGQHEAVQVHHDRQHDFGILGDLIGLQDGVVGLLGILGVQLHPAGFQLRQRVALVAVDVPGGGDGTVGVHHHDGETGAAGVVEALHHVQQALAGGSGKGTCAHSAGAQAGGHGAVLRLHIQVFALQRAVLHEVGQTLHHDGLRGDGVSGDHMGLCLTHGQCHSLVAGNKQLSAHTSASLIMVIAPSLQARLHTPQPLQ